MKRFPRLRARVLLLVQSESGMALPVALFAMISSMALASAAVMATIDVQQGSKRDGSSKSAIAAADAGANIARLRMNRYAYVLKSTTPCLRIGGSGVLEGSAAETVGGASWCPAVSGTVGAAAYSYRTTPVGVACGSYSLCVVSTGTAAGVSRRIEVAYNSGAPVGGNPKEETIKEEKVGGGNPGLTEGLIGIDSIEIDNNADARVGVGTNGSIYIHNNGNVCGNIRHGIGKEAKFDINGRQCSGYSVTEGNIAVPPVSSFMPSNIATNNSNYRLVQCTSTTPSKVPAGCQTDTYTSNWSSSVPWKASTRTISTSNNETLTLGGGDYFVCKLVLSNNSHLIMAAGSHVRIFFDTPENCGLSSVATQVDISNNADITSTGYQPSLGKYELPGLYVMGSATIKTKVEWSNNSGNNELVLYAPNSEIELANNATYVGIIVGKTVHLDNNAIVKRDPGFVLPPELNPWKEETVVTKEGTTETTPTAIYFEPQSFFECSGTIPAGAPPNANC
jgi:hypothetical protein